MTDPSKDKRETPPAKPKDPPEASSRTLGNRPPDPNAINQKTRVPPGVDPDRVWDPGNSTPDAPPVDNRS